MALDAGFHSADLLALPEDAYEEFMASLSEDEAMALSYDWEFWARPDQLAPTDPDWLTWVIDAGRGFGKTRAGSEWTRSQIENGARRVALVGETYKDLVEVMIYGDSGLLSVLPPHMTPKVSTNPHVQLTFPNGAIVLGYNATKPDQLRGPQFDAAWCDELAKWRYARETWDMLQFSLRLGTQPRALVTTTPRPIPILREILDDESTRVSRGKTMDNAANLAPSFLRQIHKRYAGTRLGRQELDAEMLDDLPNTLWPREVFDKHRIGPNDLPDLVRIVVSVDPSGAGGDEDDEGKPNEIGIVVAGLGVDDRGYVLADYTCSLSPSGWGRRTIDAYNGSWSDTPEKHRADRVVAERNYGGAMVKHVVKTADPNVPYKEVTASRGKVVRAEPVAALYEQGRVSHYGSLPELEDQMCLVGPSGFTGEGSPDRVDAAVWALTELMVDQGKE